MEIREAKEEDIPEIIDVLKASLGESKLQKSEEIWRYKHIENPFGRSLVLLATENEEIIGVRAFMRWKWQEGDTVYSAFRAVDTATHPSHQGKGVFKKLTLRAIEVAKEQGDHLIFNTPNSQSMPGYLKMGWEKVEKLEVRLMPVNPLKWSFGKEISQYVIQKKNLDATIEALTQKHTSIYSRKDIFFTPKSMNYLHWRYERNPLQDYEVISKEGFYLAAYVKEHEKFRELRVVEHLYDNKRDLRNLKRSVKNLAKKHGVQVVSLGNIGKSTSSLKVSGNFGPVLTFRNLTLGKDTENRFLSLKNWGYSLGDLELF